MSDDVVLKLEEREVVGKKLGAMRRDGWVPAVIHDHGKPSIHVMGRQAEVSKAFKAAGKNQPVDVTVGSKKFLTLIKQAPYVPLKTDLQHVVFQALKQNEKVEAEVPIIIEGDAPAEKLGYMVLHQLDSVQVQALPKDLPEKLVLPAEKLAEIGDKLTVADLRAPSGVVILTELEHTIVTVTETRASLSEQQAEEDAETADANAESAGEPSETVESTAAESEKSE